MISRDALMANRRRLVRFLLVGGGFSLAYALVTALLIGKLGFPAVVTSVLIYAACIPLAYLAQRRFTFRADRTHRGSFIIYALTQVFGLGLVSLITTRFVSGVYLLDTGLFLITAGVAAIVSFAINRLFAFRSP